jgi:peptide/nickel transport system substrate-binding protein
MMTVLCLTVWILPTAEAATTNVGESLTVGIQSTKTTQIRPLDPQERDIVSVYDLVYDSLITIDDDYLPQGSLAESWEETGSGKTWTFHLRDDVYFSDGTKLTANDVVATAQYILDRANDENSSDKGYYQNLKYFVKSISATDDTTVVVKASRKYYGILYAMTFPVLKASEIESDSPLGTGPYRISSFDAGNSIWLELNEYWWQAQPQVKQIVFTCASTAKDSLENYEYGRVDAVFTRLTAASQYKSGTSNMTLDYRTNQLETLLMNHSSSPLDDVNVRKAIRYVVDADKLASSVYMGMVTRTDTPMISGTWMYNDDLTSYFTTDVEEAKRLLEEAGWTDLDGDGVRDKPKDDGSGNYRLHLRLYVYEEPDNDVRVEVANTISDWLAEVGIECAVTTMNMSDMSTKLSSGSFDLALVSYAMDVCPDPGFLLMKSNTGNYSRYNNSTMNDLCSELRTQTTQAGYQEVLLKIQAQFAEDCPFICLYYREGAVLTRKMYTTARDVRELELLRGIETFHQ